MLIAIFLVLSPTLGRARGSDVNVQTLDGINLQASFYPQQKPGPALLLFHQCSRDLAIWGHLASALHGQGIHVLVVAPRGIGKSQGESWDYDGNLDHAIDYWKTHWSADAEAAYQWLVSQPNVDRNHVAIAGAGCGAFLALLTVQKHYPSARALIQFSGFEDSATRQFVSQTRGLAILNAVSAQDPMSLSAAITLKRVARNSHDRWLVYPEKAHGFALIETHPELEKLVVEWVIAQLHTVVAGKQMH